MVELPNHDELKKIREEYKQPETVATATQEKQEEKKVVVTPVTENKTEVKPEVVETPADKLSLDKVAEDEFLKEAERRGLKIQKETLTDEQKKKQEEIEEVEKLKFAVENNLITQEGYQEAKAILTSEGADLTKREFNKIYKADNPKATKEEIDAAYNDYYFIQQPIKLKDKRLKENEAGESELEEFEVEGNKWDERFVKLGETRRNTEAQRIKDEAKSRLENIDAAYASKKALLGKATEYGNTASQIVNELDFSAYPTKHKIKNKDISATVKFEKPDEIKADVTRFLNEDLPKIILHTDKFKDAAEIKNQINGYLRNRYADQFEGTIWDLGKTEGMNEAKVGSSSPIEREIVSDDTVVDKLAQSAMERLPKESPNFKK